MSDPAIEFRDVRRRLGNAPILQGIELALTRGQTVALVGANGAGKSTLIHALFDLRAIDAGTIRIEGRSHTDPAARDRLAYLPERFQPPYYLRGRVFIAYMLELYGQRPADAPMEAVCERLGLGTEALSRSVQTYSKGMAQMLGLAVCLLCRRPILVLDEPMAGLDPTARLRAQAALHEHRDGGGTILFTTHLLADAEALADRVAVLHGGRIVAAGTPAELVRRHGVADLEKAFAACVGAPVAA